MKYRLVLACVFLIFKMKSQVFFLKNNDTKKEELTIHFRFSSNIDSNSFFVKSVILKNDTNYKAILVTCKQLDHIPSNFFDLIWVEKLLIVGDNEYAIRSIVDERFNKLDRINYFLIDLMQLDSFNKKFYLPKLENVYLIETNIKEFPESFLKCEKLKTIKINVSEIKSIPDNIKKLKNLEYLSLHFNLIKSLPKSLFKVQQLKELDLSNSIMLNVIPKEIINLKKLKVLLLENSPILKCPENVCLLPELRLFSFSYNDNKALPSCFHSKLWNKIEDNLWKK